MLSGIKVTYEHKFLTVLHVLPYSQDIIHRLMSWGKTLSKIPLVDGYTCYHSNKSPQGYQDHRQVTVSHHSPELCPLFREGTLVCLTRVLTVTATFSSQHHELKEDTPNSKNHIEPPYGVEVIRKLGKNCSNTCWNKKTCSSGQACHTSALNSGFFLCRYKYSGTPL